MINSSQRTRLAFLLGYFVMGCAARPASLVKDASRGSVIASFVFRNMSREHIAVYLVEDTRESLLGRLDPLQSLRLPLPDRIYTARAAVVSLVVIANGAVTLQPSRERGAILSSRRRGLSLIGQTWGFAGGQLLEP